MTETPVLEREVALSDSPIPPDLSSHLDPSDVKSKGGKCDYVPWAKIRKIVNVQAAGWDFHFRQNPSKLGSVVWEAPDGETAFFMCYWTDPKGRETSDMPYTVMDYRNNPVKTAALTSKALSDNHRRAFCASACWTFNLGYQLYTGDDLLSEGEEQETEPIPAPTKAPVSPPVTERQGSDERHAGPDDALTNVERDAMIEMLGDIKNDSPNTISALQAAFRKQFGLGPKTGIRDYITAVKHQVFINDWIKNLKK